MNKDFTDIAEQFRAMMPQIKTNANGYEIRTKVLDLAKDATWNDYYARWGQFETQVVKDPKTGEIVTSVDLPEVPGADAVLETAQKFYNFVNNNGR